MICLAAPKYLQLTKCINLIRWLVHGVLNEFLAVFDEKAATLHINSNITLRLILMSEVKIID